MEISRQPSPKKLIPLALGIFIVSLGLLMFEIALTRIFSIMLSYHYVFIAVSVALLGLGIGAVFLRFIQKRIPPAEGSLGALCMLSLVFAFSIPFSMVLALKIPYTDFLAAYYAITFIPFFFAGMVFALAFDRFAEHSSKLYCASLVGSGIGPLAIIFALKSFGGANTVMLIGSASAVASVIFALGYARKKLISLSLVGFLLLSALFAVNLEFNYVGDIKSDSPAKELFSNLKNPDLDARISRTYWSPYARTDLVELGNYPDVKYIFNDGGAGMEMYRFDGDFSSIEFLRNTSAFFPFYFGDKDNVLIIGPGGGKDVLIALMGGAKNITAVEVNPDIERIVREETEFNGGIYFHENVEWVIDEGRSFLRRSTDNYDVIFMMLILTKSAREIVGYSLTESYIFTVEAFNDYLEHLTENGRLVVVVHDYDEVQKLFAIAVAALINKGKTTAEATRHIISVTETATHHPSPVFILRKTPFSMDESGAIHDIAHQPGFHPIYFPYVHEAGTAFEPSSSGEMSLEEWVSTIPFNASPATDDSPFYYNFEKGLPPSLSQLLYGVLFLSIVVALAAYLSLWHEKFSTSAKLGPFSFILYFSMLGLGFMLIEVGLIQKFILFLGQPTLSFSVLLFSLLVGGGVGSLFSDRFQEKLLQKATFVCFLIGALAFGYAVALPSIFGQFLGQDVVIRSLITAMLLLPLGFLMGMPFPIGLRIIKRSFEGGVAWMWGINGAMSVLGSILAVTVAMLFGFVWALLIGATGYFIIFLAFRLPKYR